MISDNTIVSEKNIEYLNEKIKNITELKFVESTGSQYVLTNYYPNQDTEIQIEFFTKDDSGCIICGGENWGVKEVGIWAHAISFGGHTDSYDSNPSKITYNRKYKIKATMDKTHFSKNEIVNSAYTSSNFSSPNPLTFFAVRRGGTVSEYISAKIYRLKIFEKKVLIADFIPAKKGQLIGFFENVEGVFYTSVGNSPLISGPEVLYDDAYQEIEYIEGNATNTKDGPYINTGNILNQDAMIIADFQYVNATNHISSAIFGSRSSSNTNCFGFMVRNESTTPNDNTLRWRFDYGTKQTAYPSSATKLDKNRQFVTAFKNELRLRDSTCLEADYVNFTCSNNLLLLAYYSSGNVDSCANAKLYCAEIYNSYKNQYFIPARRLSDNTIGMYELYEKKFYSNDSETGREFKYGDPVSSVTIYEDYESEDIPANLLTVSRIFEITKNDLFIDKPLSIKNLKYMYNEGFLGNPYSKYTQLEYVESNNSQYIDTDYIPSQDTIVELHCDIEYSSTAPLYGARESNNSSTYSYVLWALESSKYRYWHYGSSTDINISTSGKRYIKTDGYSGKFTVDQSTASYSKTQNKSPVPLYIFACNGIDGLDSRKVKGKIYKCAIKTGDTVEKIFIPAKRNSDGVSGLLDILHNVFYESKGDPWIPGPEIGIMPNFKIYGYDILEYAQSSSETYVDTKFTPNQDTRVTMEMQKVANTSNLSQYVFCSRYAGMPEYGLIKLANETRWRDGYAKERTFLSNGVNGASLTQRMIIDKNKNTTYIGHGTINHTYAEFSLPNTMAIYGCFEDGDGSMDYDIDMKLYWCRIYDNGILARNYYPAMRQSDNAVGLYDFVNEDFVLPMKGNLSAGEKLPIK